jgi:hypothetical protein
VPGEEISTAPVILSTRAMTKNTVAITRVIRAGDLKNFFTLLGDSRDSTFFDIS